MLRPPQLWQHFGRILVQPYAAEALRNMHRLGLLTRLFPEFQAIDSLVIRDFYHRYTVDEHSFMTLENLHRLLREKDRKRQARSEPCGASNLGDGNSPRFFPKSSSRRFSISRSSFTMSARGFPRWTDHIQGSLQALEGIQARLELPEEDWETVRFLIASHLEMSAASQRRDVFDPETVRDFAKVVGTTERLKMLCLLTYADIRAVNPEAMTPWKAELLWQLYAATANYLTRSVDDEGCASPGHPQRKWKKFWQCWVLLQAPRTCTSSWKDSRAVTPPPTPRSKSPGTLAWLVGWRPNRLAWSSQPRNDHFELTVVTADRPYLFASITGTLAAWGMSIVKADAFANAAGIILDTFRFIDLHRTLELNPSERDRFTQKPHRRS